MIGEEHDFVLACDEGADGGFRGHRFRKFPEFRIEHVRVDVGLFFFRIHGGEVGRIQPRHERFQIFFVGRDALRRIFGGGKARQEERHDAAAVEQFVASRGVAVGEETGRIVVSFVHRNHAEVIGRVFHGFFEARAHAETETCREAERADADGGVIGELDGRLVDGVGDVLAHIAEAAVIIDDIAVFRIVEERVVREIAPERIVEEASGAVVRDVRAAQIDGGNFAVGRHIHRFFRIGELHGAVSRVARIMQEEHIAEDGIAIFITCIRRDIPIIDVFPHQRIADAAADEIGGKAGVLQFFRDEDGFRRDIAFGNVVQPGGQHEVSVTFFRDFFIIFVDEPIDFGREKIGGKADVSAKKQRQKRRRKN